MTEISPTKRALLALQEMQAKVAKLEAQQREPIAVVAMACHLPGGVNSPQQLRTLLQQQGEGIVEIPPERWDVDAYYDPDPDVAGKSYTRYGGFLSDIDQFDPAFFGISPREAHSIDPQQRLLLQTAWEALENGGFDPNALYGSNTGVYVGVSNFEYGAHLIWPDDVRQISAYAGTGGSLGVTAGRLSYTFGFTGPSLIVDTACSSSLITTHLAMQALRLGECDMALSAGVNLILGPETHINFCKARMLSADGRCKTFSAAADGYARGEGVGVLVLKRLADAERDGDTILALLRGSAVNQDGPSGGLTVPNGPSQVKVIEQALAAAALTPAQIGYLEAHGTGTALGDPIEMGAIGSVFAAAERAQPLWVGSIKTNIGHLESAAGIAGLMKAILSLHHGEIYSHRHFHEPSPYIDWASLPVVIPTELTPWLTEERFAGVSSFSFSGTNAHLILSNYRDADDQGRDQGEGGALKPVAPPTQRRLLPLSAKSEAGLMALAERYATALEQLPLAKWHPFVAAAARGRGHYSHRLALVADSPQQAALRLREGGVEQGRAGAASRRLALLFTGQGAQYPGMGRELYESEPLFRQTLERCDAIATPLLGVSLLELLYQREVDEGLEAEFARTDLTQPLLFAIEYALAQLWLSWEIEVEAVMGHSVGELVAATVAGLWSLEQGMRLVCQRGKLMAERCQHGAMIAVTLSEAALSERLRSFDSQQVTLATMNGPESVTVAGESRAVAALQQQLERDGIEVKRLRVSHAFHSPLVEPMVEPFRHAVEAVTMQPLQLALVSNVSGTFIDNDEAASADYWCRHIRQPVQFQRGIKTLLDSGIDTFIEIGPKPLLTALGESIAAARGDERALLWLPSLRYSRPPWQQLLQSLARLYCHGVDQAVRGVAPATARYAVTLPTMAFITDRYWLESSSSPARAGHPLLGERIDSPLLPEGALFHNSLSTLTVSFLAHHQIFGQVVLPAAAHIEMALTAAVALLGQGAELQAVTIEQALVLPPEAELPLQMVVERQQDHYRFTLYAQRSHQWQRHTSGELVPKSQLSPQRIDLAALQQRCQQPYPVAEYYRLTRSVGIEHGEDFQAVTALWLGEGEVLAQLELPTTLSATASDFQLHPVLLDAAFQMVGVPLLARHTPFLPVGLEQLRCYRRLPTNLWCRVIAPTPEGEISRFDADLQLLDESGEVVADVVALHFQKVDPSALALTDTRYDSWLYRLDWPIESLVCGSAAALTGPKAIAAELAPLQRQLLDSCRFYRPLFERLEALAAALVCQALLDCGWQAAVGSRGTVIELIAQLAIIESQRALFRRSLQILSETGILALEGEHWQLLEPLLPLNRAEVEALQHDFIEAAAEITLTLRCGQALAQVWRGEIEPLQLLFPEGDLGVTTLLYQHSVGAKAINQLLAAAVRRAMATLPLNRAVRIVEIGGGTGGTTVQLLPQLPPQRCDYLFSDISSHFTRLAEQQFAGDYPFVRYGVIDIEQGADAALHGQFDLVIAANVVHATADLATTIDHCRQLLAPDGVVILLEAAAKQRWLDLSFGMTEGWWRFGGRDAMRHDYPLLTAAQWQQLLPQWGLSEVALLTPDQLGEGEFIKQSVIMARGERAAVAPLAGRWLLLGAADECALFANQFEQVESFTVAAWQQLDREALQPWQGALLLYPLSLDTTQPLSTQWRQLCQPLLQWLSLAPTIPLTLVSQYDATLTTAPLSSLLHGIVRTVANEQPQCQLRLLELTTEISPSERVAMVMEELRNGEGETIVTIDSDGRHLARLHDADTTHRAVVAIDAEASYLISGGLGELGLEMARYLVQQGARYLLLIGRSQPSSEAEALLSELRQQGAELEIAQLDISDQHALQQLLQQPRPPLKGVIHAAGNLADGVLQQMSWAQFESLLPAKVAGAWALHQATLEQPLDLFILLSSVASIFAPPGQGNYAAANAFLDQLARLRQRQGLPALVINWGAWSEKGLAVRKGDLAQIETQGVGTLTTAAGMAIFDRIYRWQGQVVAVPIEWPKLLQLQRELPLLNHYRQRQQRADAEGSELQGAVWLEELTQLPYSEQREQLLLAVKQQVAKVLGSRVESLDIDTGLFDLGMDSLTSVELRNQLQSHFGLDLPSTLLFKYPNIAAVSDYLLGELFDNDPPEPTSASETDIATMSDAELEALINSELEDL
ncbi:SDR family NAD(P)-dependent oxidoreductase [Ectothiorhodospiraceae bacterium BW-2]|nr:SDR family NAD(P)-dependent oxidoreductase [Ectothiorhodospiraceae bacterium BW-2]